MCKRFKCIFQYQKTFKYIFFFKYQQKFSFFYYLFRTFKYHAYFKFKRIHNNTYILRNFVLRVFKESAVPLIYNNAIYKNAIHKNAMSPNKKITLEKSYFICVLIRCSNLILHISISLVYKDKFSNHSYCFKSVQCFNKN